jgi:hypothetical protein
VTSAGISSDGLLLGLVVTETGMRRKLSIIPRDPAGCFFGAAGLRNRGGPAPPPGRRARTGTRDFGGARCFGHTVCSRFGVCCEDPASSKPSGMTGLTWLVARLLPGAGLEATAPDVGTSG